MINWQPLFVEISEDKMFFCPMCKKYHKVSPYLLGIFEDERTTWLANVITHARHAHTNYDTWYMDEYEDLRGMDSLDIQVKIQSEIRPRLQLRANTEVKKNLLKDHTDFLLRNNIKVKNFNALKNTTKDIRKLAKEKLSKKTLDSVANKD